MKNQRKKIKAYKQKLAIIGVTLVLSLVNLVAVEAQTIPDRWNYEIELHENLQKIPGLPAGPFVRLGKNEVLTVDETNALISGNNGKTWKSYPIFKNAEDFEIGARAVARTGNGTIILAFYNRAERHWTWDDKLKDAPGARLPTYVIRSLDNGRSWEEPQLLHEEWSGSIRDMIVTSDGSIVFTTMMMLHNPGRHSVLTYMSEDQGETWHRSNIIDLGGSGHHGGVTEATLEELEDGRLMKLIRTNWMQFWRAESTDNGKTWHPLGPSGIPASSAPGYLTRLESGRLLLAWNRPFPEGKNSYSMRGGDSIWSAVPVSNHRSELSVAYSEDDGNSWSDPVVIAWAKEDREVAYPFLFEAESGEIWVTTYRGPLRAKFYEEDLVNIAGN